MKTISATSINTYNNCPLQWKYKYIFHLLEPENPAFIIGTCYHKAVELFHTGQDKDFIMEEMKKLLLVNKSKEEIDRFACVRKMFEKYLVYPVEGETVQTEYKFSLDIFNGIKLIGFIDRVTPDSIIDYKTSSFDYETEETDNNIQADIYSYVFWKEKGELPNVVFQIMNKKKAGQTDYKPQLITFKKTIKDMEDLEVKLKEFYDNVEQEKFEPKEGKYCLWCPFKENCPIK